MLSKLRIDPFLLLMVGVLALASLVPVRDAWAAYFDLATTAGIVLLFFLHGAKLSRAAIIAAIGTWRLHLMVLGATFLLFPSLGLAAAGLTAPALDPLILSGLIYLSVLPSTVQSSIAFTSIAGGNVPAAVCSASLSNVLGIGLTPLLATVLIGIGVQSGGSGFFLGALGKIAGTLLLPFLAGHLARPLIGKMIDAHRSLVMRVDRGVILLVVYTAFSASVIEGLWRRLQVADLAILVAVLMVLLAVVLACTWAAARRTGLSTADEIVLVFCGSKKSLASGVPMAGALFPAAQVGLIILPLMIFHQLQLIVCAILAQRYAQAGSERKETDHALRNA
jgi:sodium/bile acid cotransporter 7